MSLQNEEAFITNGRIILSGNIRGMVRDEGCCNALSYIQSVYGAWGMTPVRLQEPHWKNQIGNTGVNTKPLL